MADLHASGTAVRFCVIGAGSMGSLYGGLLARAGFDVTLLDVWAEHIEAIRRDGLRLDGITGDVVSGSAQRLAPTRLRPPTSPCPHGRQRDPRGRRRRPDDSSTGGFALTLQNGIGNVEALAEALGRARVAAGLSYHSAAVRGPGEVSHTHAGPTWLGELDGARTPRLERLATALRAAGFASTIVQDIQGLIWAKFVHNSAINAICAVTGLRVGEISSHPGADELQTRIIEEALAVVRAHGIVLPDPDPMRSIKDFCRVKFNKPSMLQHVEQGKRTEIDALNGAIVRPGHGWECRRPTTRRSCGSPGPSSSACGAWSTRAHPTTLGSRPRPRPRPNRPGEADRPPDPAARRGTAARDDAVIHASTAWSRSSRRAGPPRVTDPVV